MHVKDVKAAVTIANERLIQANAALLTCLEALNDLEYLECELEGVGAKQKKTHPEDERKRAS